MGLKDKFKTVDVYFFQNEKRKTKSTTNKEN